MSVFVGEIFNVILLYQYMENTDTRISKLLLLDIFLLVKVAREMINAYL